MTVGRGGMHTILGAARPCGKLSGIRREAVVGYEVNPSKPAAHLMAVLEVTNRQIGPLLGRRSESTGPPVVGDRVRRIEEQYAANDHPFTRRDSELDHL